MKSDLITPVKLFKHIAAEVEAGKPELAFSHFSPSDKNWDSLRSMDKDQQKAMAAAFRRARPAKILNDHARTYEIPFEEGGGTQWAEVGLSQGPDGIWAIYSW